MIVNASKLLELAPIADMEQGKVQLHGVSYGLSEAGYDIRIKQDVVFGSGCALVFEPEAEFGKFHESNFVLASAIERFQMPSNLVGIVHDKSTWARRGLSVFNTVIEPGWKGFLTLELVYHGKDVLHIPAGSGIAQVVFHQTVAHASYDGKYQNQSDEPVPAIYV